MLKTALMGVETIGLNSAYLPISQGLGGLLEKFNPLGSLSEAYNRTLAYRLETKQLDAELAQIHHQAALAHDRIDKSFREHMGKLLERRAVIDSYVDTLQKELGDRHIERLELLRMASDATAHMLSPGISLEERQLCRELVTTLTAQLSTMGNQGNQSLKGLLDILSQAQSPNQTLLTN